MSGLKFWYGTESQGVVPMDVDDAKVSDLVPPSHILVDIPATASLAEAFKLLDAHKILSAPARAV